MSNILLRLISCLCVLALSLWASMATAVAANECAILATEAGNDLAVGDPTRYEHLTQACDNQRRKPSIAPRATPSAPVAQKQGKLSPKACGSGANPHDTPPASPSLDPFQIDYYSKLYTYKAPDCQTGVPAVKVGKIGIEVGLYYLEDWLKKLSEARDGLLELCVGFHGDKQVVEYRGHRVAASPDWLRACNQRASLLASGEPQALVEALRKWNVIAGSNYVRPRAQDAVDAWTLKKSNFVHFGGTNCDDASHDIMIRVPLGQVTHKAVYERYKGGCSPEWRALFEPAELAAERAKKEAKARLTCRPGTTYMIVDEKSGNGAREACNPKDRTVDPDASKAEVSKAKDSRKKLPTGFAPGS